MLERGAGMSVWEDAAYAGVEDTGVLYRAMFCPAWLCKRQLSRAKAEKGGKNQNYRMIRDWR